MITEFKLPERFIGFAAAAAGPGDQVPVICSEALTSLDGVNLTWRLEGLQNSVFSQIPNAPDPTELVSLLVVIRRDLSAVAYANEPLPVVHIRSSRPIAAGETISKTDITDILAVDLGVAIPPDCGVIFVQTVGWRKALYYDLCPLADSSRPRTTNVSDALARQLLSLVRGQFADVGPAAALQTGIDELSALLASRENDETKYQEFFVRRPWFLGGLHTQIDRHTHLDDENIPDYTGLRAADKHRDIFEVKPPFMSCFRQDGDFNAAFHAAWTQAERYLAFARQQHHYLRDKGLSFNNPRCYLVLGHDLSDAQQRALSTKEGFNPSITVLTYDRLLSVGRSFQEILHRASAP